ncbi:MAG: molybdopterin cofactor-binding domain-containing protein [Ilumatobacteraceae bacterium]
MNVSTARCVNTELVMKQHVISGQFASGFALGLLAKDVGIVNDLAEALGAELPLPNWSRRCLPMRATPSASAPITRWRTNTGIIATSSRREKRSAVGSILGNRVARVEDPRMLTAGGVYVDDIDLPDAVWVTYVRSAVAHARIASVDVEDAAASPGVVRVFTADDISALGRAPHSNRTFAEKMRRPFLAVDVVRYVGEAVVAVVSETPQAGADAVDLVVVEYDELPVVIDAEESARDAVLLFPELGSNAVTTLATSAPADFSGCDVVVEERIVNQRLSGSPIEARVGAAYWTPEGRLVHYSACQGAHPTRDVLAEVYRLDPADVRVIVPDVGGGFGVKSRSYPDEIALGYFAKVLGRPARWTETRSENFLAMPQGRGQVQHAKIGGSRDGRVLAYQLDVIQDAGAYPLTGAVLHGMTMRMTTGCYDIPSAGFTGTSTVTNAPSVTAYRGAGRPEAAVAIERMVDRFAAEIGMDPAEVRRRNLVPRFVQPYTTAVGTPYDVGDYPQALEKALAAARYDELRAEQAERRANGDPIALGIGLAVYVEITSGVGGSEFGSVELLADGGLRVRTGCTPYGQGHVTTWAMIVADRTGVSIERIEVIHGDTDEIRSGGLTVGSRSVQLGGSAIAAASTQLIERAKDRVADILEAAADDVVLDADGGSFFVAGTPARSVSWADLATSDGEPLSGDHDFTAPMPTFPFGAHVAVVEIDTETGRARLRRLVAVDDAGTLINPLIAEGQIHGGIAQGVAQALYEEIVFDADGTPKTTNFADYAVISAGDLPSFELTSMATPTWVNELGAKGVGESGTIGAIPSTYNAVIDALAHLGVRHMEMPCTPQRVWDAIQAAAAREMA